MVRPADLPYAARRLYFGSQPVDPPGGYPAPSFAHPLSRAGTSIAVSSHLRRPPNYAYPLDRPECYGAGDPRGHGPPPLDEQPPGHREGCCDRVPGGLSASIPPRPPPDRRAGYRVDAHSVVTAPAPPSAPDRHTGPGSGRHLRPVPYLGTSPPTRSPQDKRYREHHHRTCDESSRSPRLHLPLRGSKSLPLAKRERLEDGRKKSKSLPSSKRYRLEDGREDSSSGGQWYDDDERDGTRELTYPSSSGHRHRRHGHSMRKSSPCSHGMTSFRAQHHSPPRKLLLPIMMSPWDDGYKSPSSPTYRCEDEIDIGKGAHGDDWDEKCAPDWTNPASNGYDGSEITGRIPNFKHEDSSYDVLVDSFMDAVLKNWREPVNPDIGAAEACQKQTIRFAELALKRHNKNKDNKVKYRLVEAIADSPIYEDNDFYAHVNFYASAKKNAPKVLVFAELRQVGLRPNAMILTSFHVLDEKKQFAGRWGQVQRSNITPDRDLSHCYACGDDIKHPDGSCYKAGHLVGVLRYHYDV